MRGFTISVNCSCPAGAATAATRWPISTASASGRMKSTRAKVMAKRTLGTHGVGSAGDGESQAPSAGTTDAIGGRFTLLDGARRDRAANPGRMGDLDPAGLAPR